MNIMAIAMFIGEFLALNKKLDLCLQLLFLNESL